MINGNIKFDMLFKRGDTTAINIALEEPLDNQYKLKIGLFDERGRLIWSIVANESSQATWTKDGLNCLINLDYNVTKELIGNITLRATIFKTDGSYVNSGEQIMTLRFVDEPINRNII